VQSANDITNSVDVLIEAFNTLGDLGLAGIFKLFTEKKITKVEDIGQMLQLPKKLPSLFSDMRSAIEALKGTAKDLQTRAPQLGDILDSSWQSESAPVKDAIAAIQTSVRNNLLEKINAITGRVNQVQDVLNGLVGRGLTPKVDVKVTSYSRWTDVSTDMPYSKWTRGTYSIAGFKTTFDYPEFFTYPYAARASFPNHHIPYIRVELGNTNTRRSFVEPHSLDNNASSLILDTPANIPVSSLPPSVALDRNLFAMTCILAAATVVILIFVMFTSARKILRNNRTVHLQPEEMTS
jgi:Sec-independent protein translocase protein TatA